jgi:hypothetical protein
MHGRFQESPLEPSATAAASDIDLYKRKTITSATVMIVQVTARMIPSHVISEAIILPAMVNIA